MNIFKKFLNFSIEEKKESKFEQFFRNKYSQNQVIDEIDSNLYKKIKFFFSEYNYEANLKTFTERGYHRYDFSFLKIITKEDLMWIKYYCDNSRDNQDIDKLKQSFKEEILRKYEKNDELFFKPVEWKEFFYVIKEILDSFSNSSHTNSNLQETNVVMNEQFDKILIELANKIKERKFNFEHYHHLFRKTKQSLVFNAMKFGIFINKNDPDFQVIREKSNFKI